MSVWRKSEDPLVGLTDRARVDAAVAARNAQRDQTLRASELATLSGTLLDLAEDRGTVTVTTMSGREYRGTATAVATDHVAIRATTGHETFVRLAAIALVRPAARAHAPLAQGDRTPAQDLLLTERCERRVARRPEVAIAVQGVEHRLCGRLLAVAEDLLNVALDATDTPAFIAAGAVEAVTFDPSHGGPHG